MQEGSLDRLFWWQDSGGISPERHAAQVMVMGGWNDIAEARRRFGPDIFAKVLRNPPRGPCGIRRPRPSQFHRCPTNLLLGLRCVVRDYNPPALGSALALTSVALKFDVVMNNAEQPHVQRAQQAQDEILRAMSPGRRLEVARELYDTAWQIKAAGLRRQHPDWSEEFLLAKLRRVFVTGYAGA